MTAKHPRLEKYYQSKSALQNILVSVDFLIKRARWLRVSTKIETRWLIFCMFPANSNCCLSAFNLRRLSSPRTEVFAKLSFLDIIKCETKYRCKVSLEIAVSLCCGWLKLFTARILSFDDSIYALKRSKDFSCQLNRTETCNSTNGSFKWHSTFAPNINKLQEQRSSQSQFLAITTSHFPGIAFLTSRRECLGCHARDSFVCLTACCIQLVALGHLCEFLANERSHETLNGILPQALEYPLTSVYEEASSLVKRPQLPSSCTSCSWGLQLRAAIEVTSCPRSTAEQQRCKTIDLILIGQFHNELYHIKYSHPELWLNINATRYAYTRNTLSMVYLHLYRVFKRTLDHRCS